jgi:hypothetical protein
MHDLHDLMKNVSCLENLAKERLQSNVAANSERLKFLTQFMRYGICTCHCHFSTSVYHSAVPCCGNAKLTAKMQPR